MAFWGCQVKPGTTVSCEPGDGFFIHLTQAALGETKKGSENVVLFVKAGDKKLAFGTLSADKHPQISSDSGEDEGEELETDEIPVKNNETEKSAAKFPAKDGKKDKQDHDSESDDSGTFSSETDDSMSEHDSSDEDDTSSGTDDSQDEETPVKPEAGKKRAVATALKTPASDKKAKISTLKKETDQSAAKVPAKDGKKDKQDDGSDSESDDSGTSSSETDDSMSEDDSSDEDDTSSGTDDSSGDDSEDEETPVKLEVGMKIAVATALKTPASDKKAKISTPKKETGDKKSVHVATPHPAKQASKTPADGKRKEKAAKSTEDSKAKEKSPKLGSHSCKSCSKTFNSAAALESHQKAKKHEA